MDNLFVQKIIELFDERALVDVRDEADKAGILVRYSGEDKDIISKDLLSIEEAKKIVTTLSFDLSKYGDMVKVYKIGSFSTEFCGGPHVTNTGDLASTGSAQAAKFKIAKEEAVAAGVRRIKAVLE